MPDSVYSWFHQKAATVAKTKVRCKQKTVLEGKSNFFIVKMKAIGHRVCKCPLNGGLNRV